MCVRRFVPQAVVIAPVSYQIAISGLMLTLFFVGASISPETLKAIGWKSLVLGMTLWAFVSLTSLILVTIINPRH